MMEMTSSPVVVARIIRPHGIHGEVVVESLSDVEGRIENTSTFLLMDEDRFLKGLQVETRRFFRDRHVLKFHGIPTRTEAEELRGKLLGIPEEELGTLPRDQYFIHQLVGMKVFKTDGTEVGIVVNVIRTGGVDLLEVGNKGEILIPFAAEICIEVNPESQRILIDPPEGLLQLNAY